MIDGIQALLQTVLGLVGGIVLALGVAGIFGYWLLLNNPKPIGSSGTSRRNETGAETSAKVSAEKATWASLLLRWGVMLAAGGSTDAAAWSNRFAHVLDRSLGQVQRVLVEKSSLGPSSPQGKDQRGRDYTRQSPFAAPPSHSSGRYPTPGQTHELANGSFSGPPELSTHSSSSEERISLQLTMCSLSSDLGVPGGLPGLPPGVRGNGVVLPVIGDEGISSRVDGSTTTIYVPVDFRDDQLLVSLRGQLPLLFGALPLGIPADLLSVHANVDIRGIRFVGTLAVRIDGQVIDISFPSLPQWELAIESMLGRQRQVPGGAKVEEIVNLAARRALHKLVAPNFIRATLVAEKPFVVWSSGSGQMS